MHYRALKISPEEAAMIEEAKRDLGLAAQPAQPSKKRKRLPLKKKKSKVLDMKII